MSIEKFSPNHPVAFTISNRDQVSKEYNAIVNSLENEELKKVFNVKVSAADLNAMKDLKLEALAKNLTIKGFRPGKAPLAVVWKQHEASLTSEILNDIINSLSHNLVEKLDVNLFASPKAELQNFSFEEGLEFGVTLELLPKIDLPDIKKISLTKPTYEIKEEDIKARAKEIAQHRKNFVSADDKHKSKNGDQVVIDFEGKIDGVAFAGGTAKNHSLELGSKSFIGDFEEQLVGRKKGDSVTVKVTFPADYHEQKFASQAAEFDVTINEIKTSEAFKDDEELAKAVGFESSAELYDRIKESLDKECENKVKVEMKIELFDVLDKACNFTLPQSLLDEEFAGLWRQVEELRKNGSAETDKPEEKLKEEYLTIAKRRVKLGLLLSKMAEHYAVKIEQQDIIDAVRAQIATQHPSMAQVMLDYYTKNPKAIEGLKGPILEEKTVACILKEVAMTEKATTVNKLLEVEKK